MSYFNPVYTLHLDPTPAQIDALRQLHSMGLAVRLACWQQHQLTLHASLNVSVAALLSGQGPAGQSLQDEVRAVLTSPVLAGAPWGLVEDAIKGTRQALEQAQRTGKPYQPSLYAGVLFAGDGLLLDISSEGVWLAGVEGMVRAHITGLPRWAQAVIRKESLTGPDGPVNLRGADITGWVCIEGYHHQRAVWSLDLELHWPEYSNQPALLAPLFEAPDDLSPARQAMSWLMGWDHQPGEQADSSTGGANG